MKLETITNSLKPYVPYITFGATGSAAVYATKAAADLARSYNYIGEKTTMGIESTALLLSVAAIQAFALALLTDKVFKSLPEGKLFQNKKKITSIAIAGTATAIILGGLSQLAVKTNLTAHGLSVFGIISLTTTTIFSNYLSAPLARFIAKTLNSNALPANDGRKIDQRKNSAG